MKNRISIVPDFVIMADNCWRGLITEVNRSTRGSVSVSLGRSANDNVRNLVHKDTLNI